MAQKYVDLLYVKQQTSDLPHPVATDHSWRPFIGQTPLKMKPSGRKQDKRGLRSRSRKGSGAGWDTPSEKPATSVAKLLINGTCRGREAMEDQEPSGESCWRQK